LWFLILKSMLYYIIWITFNNLLLIIDCCLALLGFLILQEYWIILMILNRDFWYCIDWRASYTIIILINACCLALLRIYPSYPLTIGLWTAILTLSINPNMKPVIDTLDPDIETLDVSGALVLRSHRLTMSNSSTGNNPLHI